MKSMTKKWKKGQLLNFSVLGGGNFGFLLKKKYVIVYLDKYLQSFRFLSSWPTCTFLQQQTQTCKPTMIIKLIELRNKKDK